MFCSQLVRVMVSPVNSPGATASCQKSMYQCGLLQQLCTILMATGVPADILTEVITVVLKMYYPTQRTIVAFSEGLTPLRHSSLWSGLFLSDHQHCIRGYQRLTGQPGLLCICQRSFKPTKVRHNQCTKILNRPYPSDPKFCIDLTFSLISPSSARRPAIVVLLMSMVNERQPFVLRCAVLYCFQCFLYKNQKGQGEIVATLLPSTIDGQLYQVENLEVALSVV